MWITTDDAMKGQEAAGGKPTTKAMGKATSEPSRWITAVSRALSLLDLTSAFQLACSRAPNSTAATTGQVRVIQCPASQLACISQGAAARALQVVGQRRRREPRCLGLVVPDPQPYGLHGTTLADESFSLPRTENAALQRQRPLRIVGQGGEVTGPDHAQVALGIDVQLDRLDHGVAEQAAQERQRAVLVNVIDALQRRRRAEVVQQMPEVVQQCRRDQFIAGIFGFRQLRALQRVLELRHRFARILLRA